MIKAIIFDLGRVIVPFELERAYALMESRCGIPAAQLPSRIRATDLVRQFETGLIEPEEFHSQFTAHLGMDVSWDEFCGIWTSIFLPHTLVPESLLRGLAARYRMVLLSNTNAIHFEMLHRSYPLLRHFHRLVLSHEVKAMKPHPEIYRRAIEAAGCQPGECFFTDDMPEFVAGALAAGIDAVQFENAAQVERELRARGVEWSDEAE